DEPAVAVLVDAGDAAGVFDRSADAGVGMAAAGVEQGVVTGEDTGAGGQVDRALRIDGEARHVGARREAVVVAELHAGFGADDEVRAELGVVTRVDAA